MKYINGTMLMEVWVCKMVMMVLLNISSNKYRIWIFGASTFPDTSDDATNAQFLYDQTFVIGYAARHIIIKELMAHKYQMKALVGEQPLLMEIFMVCF